MASRYLSRRASIRRRHSGWLTQKTADLFVVCDYGQILSRETLRLARLGGINLHASLLPKYRGAAPINWAIYHGETETGVTVIHMTPQLDAGPCLVQRQRQSAATKLRRSWKRGWRRLASRRCSGGDRDARQRRKQSPALLQDAKFATQGAAAEERRRSGRLVALGSARFSIRYGRWSLGPKRYTFWNRSGEEPLRLILEKVQRGGCRSTARSACGAPGTWSL